MDEIVTDQLAIVYTGGCRATDVSLHMYYTFTFVVVLFVLVLIFELIILLHAYFR